MPESTITPAASSIAARFAGLQQAVATAHTRFRLSTTSPTLIAVSKRQPEERVRAALEAGQRVFGENKVQEAQARWKKLKQNHPGITLHLIGPLQRNKVKEAVTLFDTIHTVDREKLVDALAKEMERQSRLLPCFLQINTGEESQKSGVAPQDVEKLLTYARERGLNIVGLMCIPPADEPPAPHFALLGRLAERYGLTQLSMGMSSDFEDAIRFGATHIRIGTALFGTRE